MRMKASAYKQYGDAAILSLVLEALPQVSTVFCFLYKNIFCLGSREKLIFMYSMSGRGEGGGGGRKIDQRATELCQQCPVQSTANSWNIRH